MTPQEQQKRELVRALLAGAELPVGVLPQAPPRDNMMEGAGDPAPHLLSPQGFQSYREGSLGADRTFAPGPGTRVAQNETVNDAIPPEELAQLAAQAGFDANALNGLDLNSTEAKNLGWTLRMMQAESILRQHEDQGTKMWPKMLEWLPGEALENKIYGSGALGTDPDYQKYVQAREGFANAALRADTGAQINESEIPRMVKEFMPLPGDGPEQLAQKRAQREAFMMATRAGSGPAAAFLPDFGTPVVEYSDEMSDEDFKAWLESQ